MMKRLSIVLVLALASSLTFGAPSAVAADLQGEAAEPFAKISSRVEIDDSGGRAVIEEVLVDAPVETVWDAYSTSKGWMAWVAPVAKVDLRLGGSIRTHYNADAKIGDPGTNVLHIVNFVPRRILTLQAELQDNWPEIMKRDAEHLMNVIVFDALPDQRTRIKSYGVGYGASPEYDKMLAFFVEANKGLYEKLIEYAEAVDANVD